MDYSKIRELLKGLIDDSASTELAEKVGKISGEIDNLEQEDKSFVSAYEDLLKKYIQAIKDTSFKEAPKEESTPQAKSLEECFQEVLDNRKD